MTTPIGAVAVKAASAIEKLRPVETPRRALPVPCSAIAGWNRRVADWAAA